MLVDVVSDASFNLKNLPKQDTLAIGGPRLLPSFFQHHFRCRGLNWQSSVCRDRLRISRLPARLNAVGQTVQLLA